MIENGHWSEFSRCAETIITNEKIERDRLKSASSSSSRWHQYTPHISITSTEPQPTILELINQKERVYYRYEDNETIHENEDVPSELEAEHVTTKSILDLGVAPLQRIIYEMKHLTTNSSKKTIENVSDGKGNYMDLLKEANLAAREAGLQPYCSYLKNNVHEPDSRNHRRLRGERGQIVDC